MNNDHYSCPICLALWDQTLWVPQILPNCGHTIYTECLKEILNSSLQPKCPLDNDNLPLQDPKLTPFPINFAIKQLLEDRELRGVCQEHGEDVINFCLTDKCKICNEYYFEGKHKGHEVQTIRKTKQEVEEGFDKIKTLLEQKEEILVTGINLNFVEKIDYIDRFLGLFSSLYLSTGKIISDLTLYMKKEDYLNIREENIDPAFHRYRSFPCQLQAGKMSASVTKKVGKSLKKRSTIYKLFGKVNICYNSSYKQLTKQDMNLVTHYTFYQTERSLKLKAIWLGNLWVSSNIPSPHTLHLSFGHTNFNFSFCSLQTSLFCCSSSICLARKFVGNCLKWLRVKKKEFNERFNE